MIIFIGCKQSTKFPLDIPSKIDLNKISTDSLVHINKLKCINYAIFDEPCLELINDKAKKAIRLTIKRKQLETIILTIQSLTDGGAIISKKVIAPESFHLTSIYTIGYNQTFSRLKKIEPQYDFSVLMKEISFLCSKYSKISNSHNDTYCFEYFENGDYNYCNIYDELNASCRNLVDRLLNEVVRRSDFK